MDRWMRFVHGTQTPENMALRNAALQQQGISTPPGVPPAPLSPTASEAGNTFVDEEEAYPLNSGAPKSPRSRLNNRQTLKAPPPRNRTQESIDKHIARTQGFAAAKAAAPPVGIDSTASSRPVSRGTPAALTVRPPTAANRPAGKPSGLVSAYVPGKTAPIGSRRGGSKTQKKGARLRKTARNIPALI
jgi:hypothetical protein